MRSESSSPDSHFFAGNQIDRRPTSNESGKLIRNTEEKKSVLEEEPKKK